MESKNQKGAHHNEFGRIDTSAGFERLYRENWSLLFNIAYKRIRSTEKTEEIIQELFINIWDKREQLGFVESPRAYLITALKSRVLNHLRNELIRSRHHDLIRNEAVTSAAPCDREIEFQELQKLVDTEVSRLPEKCRQVYLLSRNDELSLKEISERLNISVNTTEKHIGKALKLLRLNLRNIVSLLFFTHL